MAKRTKTGKSANRKNTSALAKAAKNVPGLPAVSAAAAAIPVTAIVLAVGACAVGALAFLLLSGTAGQRRRELIRHKALQAGHEVSETISKGRQRLESVATEAKNLMRGERSGSMANGRRDQALGEKALNI